MVNDFFKHLNSNLYATVFDNSVTFIADCQKSISDKPVRLGILLNFEQLLHIQSLLKDDLSMFNSIQSLIEHYDDLKIIYGDDD